MFKEYKIVILVNGTKEIHLNDSLNGTSDTVHLCLTAEDTPVCSQQLQLG